MLQRIATASLFCVLGSIGQAASARAQEPNLDALLSDFRQLPGVEARFVEEKRLAMLRTPVRSRGQIWFAPNPTRLMRRVTEPERSDALIADGALRMRTGDQIEEISIDDNPVLRGFVDSFRAVLAGDRRALERFYTVALSRGEAEGSWTLRLLPRDAALRRFLREIVMDGEGTTIRRMRMVEVSGDETRTEFSDVNPARRFSASEQQRIFHIAP